MSDADTTPTDAVRLFVDGDQWCALMGENVQGGHAGFAPTRAEALAELALEIAEVEQTPLGHLLPARLASRSSVGASEDAEQLRRDLDSANDQIASIAAALGLDDDDDTPLLHALEQRLAAVSRLEPGDRERDSEAAKHANEIIETVRQAIEGTEFDVPGLRLSKLAAHAIREAVKRQSALAAARRQLQAVQQEVEALPRWGMVSRGGDAPDLDHTKHGDFLDRGAVLRILAARASEGSPS